jgi:hypothetical protein
MAKTFRDRGQSHNEELDELLSAYLDGMLPQGERTRLEARLRQDPALRERLEGLQLTVRALSRLPQVEAPRNFILSPAMVAPPKRARRRPKRRTWPVFGWATAAVALLFALVFATDLFVVAPAVRREPSDTVARVSPAEERMERETEPMSVTADEVPAAEQALPEQGNEEEPMMALKAPTEAIEVTVVEEAEASTAAGDETAMAQAVEEGTLAAEAQREMGQPEPTSDDMAAAEAVEAATAQPGGGGGEPPTITASEKVLESAVTASAEAPLGSALSTPTVMATPVTDVEQESVLTPPPPATQRSAQPSPLTENETVAEVSPVALPGPEATPSPEAVAIAPLAATTEASAAVESETDVPVWLRLLEISLGLAIVGLGTATLVLRWRGV